ncbi:MAG: serine/threonine-protein kinase [Isosphaeraceae bacterium]
MNPTKPGDDPSADEDLSASEGSLAQTLEEFLGLAKSGVRPSREEFLARHPDRADALAECLDGLEFILSAVPELVGGETGEVTGEFEGSLDAPAAIMPSTLLGDYRIVREVGRGGMGVVFEAQQLSLGRKVALKVLPFAASLDPRQRQRFQLEAQAAAHLHHPHIVPVFAVGRDRGIHYYAMQFIDGRTLSSLVREIRRATAETSATGPGGPRAEILHAARTPSGNLSDTENPSVGSEAPTKPSGSNSGRREADYFRAVARIGKQAALALDHAHGLGVIHRDVKPGNLMLDAEGDLWVTDFGLARFLDEPGVTRTGDLLGTLAYMSPEQALGRREADHRGDLYSLGATLDELLTLRPPFEGRDRQELLRKIAHEDPVHPRRIDPTVPLDLETIVLKSMEKEASARYPSARELADELDRFLSDEPIRARRPGPIEHLAKWSRRHRTAVVTASTVLMLAMAVGTVLMIGERQRTEKARQDLRQSFLKMVQVADVVTLEAIELASVTSMDEKTSSARKAESQRIFSKAHDFYEMAAAQPQSDDAMRALVAHATHRLAFTKMLTGRNGGEATFALSVARYEDLIARAGKNFLRVQPAFDLRRGQGPENTRAAAGRDLKDGLHLVNMAPLKDYRLGLAETLERTGRRRQAGPGTPRRPAGSTSHAPWPSAATSR